MTRNQSVLKLAAAIVGAFTFTVALLLPGGTAAAEAPLDLGFADSFAVLAGTTVTNTGPSIIDGDLGVCPGTAITGFLPGLVVGGASHSNDTLACAAQAALILAYDDAAGRAPLVSFAVPTDLGGMTLTTGVYMSPTSFAVTGTLALDAAGDPNAVFIFQAGSTVVTATDSVITLLNGAQACNVYWQVGSSATLGVRTSFVGSILALTSITANTNATVQGRLLARNGATTLDSNLVLAPTCAATPPTTTTTEPPTTTTTASPTTTTSAAPTTTTTTTSVTPTSTTTSTSVAPSTTTTTSQVVPPTTTTTGVGTPATTTTTTTLLTPTSTTSTTTPTPTTSTTSTSAVVPTPTTVAVLTETPRGQTTATIAQTGSTTTTPQMTTDRTERLPETGTDGARAALLGVAILSLGYATHRLPTSVTPLRRRSRA
ncbi:MAG: hypothetical protein QOI61_1264 [Actinomycetota bacterium]